MSRFLSRYKVEILIFLFSLPYFYFLSRYGIDIDDEGFHLYVSNLLLKGLVPYRDFVLHATPGSFYLQAFMFKILSPTIFAGRLSMVMLGIYITIILFESTRYIVKSIYFAAISSILFIFWGVSHIRHPWYGWYGLACALTFLFFGLRYLNINRYLYLFFSGFFCGIAFLMKQNLGVACFVSYGLFLIIDTIFLRVPIKDGFLHLLKKILIFLLGVILILGIVIFYFYIKGGLMPFFYYVFKFAAASARGRFIFNPYPHIKSSSLLILAIFLLILWFWKNHKKKMTLFSTMVFILGGIFFIFNINKVDQIYIMDHIKTGAVNGFFNIATLSIWFGLFIVLKGIFKKQYENQHNRLLLFIVLFSIFYTWFALCISRDHLHLVLGMPPAYILAPFMLYKVNRKFHTFLILPLIFVSYFGFFTSLKNEGLRAVSPPIVNMHSELDVKKGRGIIVTKEDKDMIEGMVGYINSNTEKDERIFDTYKSSLFYFLSDRIHPSFYYVLHPDMFRFDKQEDVIKDIVRYDINLVITEKDKWNNLIYYTDKNNNPLTFKIWRYIVDNYEVRKDFGKYYILIKKNMG